LKTNQLPERFLAALFVVISLLYACNNPDFIGIEVQPLNDKFNLYYNDTCSVLAHTVREDSIRTDKTVLNLLGNYDDPIFGRTSASICTQIRLSSNNVEFGPNPIADSLVLTLAYKGYYGKLRKMNINIYEITDNIYKDSAYYSTTVVGYNPVPLASTIIIPKPNDSIDINGERLPAHLRINMGQALSQKFLNESGSVNLSDNDKFLEFFKGIFITSSFTHNEGAILYFDLLSTLSQMTLFYKNDNNDSLKYSFVINDNCARFNLFNHYNYSNAHPLLQQQINGDTLLGDSLLYLQAMAGLKVKLSFPSFKKVFTENNMVLNKAELILPIEENVSQSNYPLPEKLTLVRLNESGQIAYLIDQFEGESHFRGIYNETDKTYNFTITRHLQNILLDNIQDYGLYLMVSGSGINGSRAFLKGTNRSSQKIKLKLIYTKL